MSELGVPVASEKTEGPQTVLVILGLELDSDEMVVRVPMEKVGEIMQKIEAVLSKRKVTLRTIQSLVCCNLLVGPSFPAGHFAGNS